MAVWIIVLKMTIINLGAPELMSNMAFASEAQCQYAISGEPHSDRVVCRPLQLVAMQDPHSLPKPKGEVLEP